ncbi:hypothetical protein HZA33_02435 [Candidatus Pacearchaeota archaeon]|nr:hypothetical protein [Candidatus Pacearchaeota archaeon]
MAENSKNLKELLKELENNESLKKGLVLAKRLTKNLPNSERLESLGLIRKQWYEPEMSLGGMMMVGYPSPEFEGYVTTELGDKICKILDLD